MTTLRKSDRTKFSFTQTHTNNVLLAINLINGPKNMWPKTHGIRIYMEWWCATFGVIAFWWGGKWQPMNYYERNKGIGRLQIPHKFNMCLTYISYTAEMRWRRRQQPCNDNELHHFDLCVISVWHMIFASKETKRLSLCVSFNWNFDNEMYTLSQRMNGHSQFDLRVSIQVLTLCENEYSTICCCCCLFFIRKEPIQMEWLRIARVKSLLKP